MDEPKLTSPVMSPDGLSPVANSELARTTTARVQGTTTGRAQRGFLLADFLSKRLEDWGEDEFDADMMQRLNNLLENDMLGDEEAEFPGDSPSDQNQRDTDDNVENEIAKMRSLNKSITRDQGFSKRDYHTLHSPLLANDRDFDSISRIEGKRVNFQFDDEDNKTHLGGQTYYEVASQLRDVELKTVREAPDDIIVETNSQYHSSKGIDPDPNTEETGSLAIDQYEFYSAAEYQTAYALSKAGDASTRQV